MKQYGDITKIHGAEVPPVEVIIGGSPCQDLSIAGQRRGLSGERSGLFLEMIRVIKEMRESTNGKYPRFMVWENVPGTFSSNKGADFRQVLEEIAKIADPDAVIPGLKKGQRWKTAGAIVGDGWSLAWRVLDAQFWGVPQRRRRIALVADFTGQCAAEILFERESVSGDPPESGTSREEAAGSSGTGTYPAIARAIAAQEDGSSCVDCRPNIVYCVQGNVIDRNAGCNGSGWKEDISYTLNTVDRPAVAYSIGNGQIHDLDLDTTAKTLNCMHDQQAVVVYDARGYGNGHTINTIVGDHDNRINNNTTLVAAVDVRNSSENEKRNGTYQCRSELNSNNVVRVNQTVRRLTPLECERLQGFPDGWTDIGEWTDSSGKIRRTSDMARYKAIGNSIAIPPWTYVLSKLNGFCREHTMASLFDGIGGFPLIWERLNGSESCLWASEIEEFPIAVTKRRFAE